MVGVAAGGSGGLVEDPLPVTRGGIEVGGRPQLGAELGAEEGLHGGIKRSRVRPVNAPGPGLWGPGRLYQLLTLVPTPPKI